MKRIRFLSYSTIINAMLSLIVLIGIFINMTAGKVNAQVPPHFLSPRLKESGQLSFELETLTGTRYRIERSTDLVVWQPWTEFEATEPVSTISLENVADEPVAFFKAETLFHSLQNSLDEAKRKWAKINWQNYRLQIDVSEFIPRELSQGVITVEDGQVTDVALPLANDQVLGGQFNYQLSVNGLFEWLQSALGRTPHSADITFHPELGYPLSASIDYDPLIADEESGFRVTLLGPTEVIAATPFELANAPYRVHESTIVDNNLSIDLEYGGGCRSHFFALVDLMPGVFAESEPPRPLIALRHDNHDDRCRALVRETRTFSLVPLALSATLTYGQPIPMILEFGTTSGGDGTVTSILYSPAGTDSFLLGEATSQAWVGGVQGSGSGTDYRFKLTLLGQTLPNIEEVWIGQRRFEPTLRFPKGKTADTVTQGDTLELLCHFRREPVFEGLPFESEIVDWRDVPPISAAPTYEGAAILHYNLDGITETLSYSSIETLPELLFP